MFLSYQGSHCVYEIYLSKTSHSAHDLPMDVSEDVISLLFPAAVVFITDIPVSAFTYGG